MVLDGDDRELYAMDIGVIWDNQSYAPLKETGFYLWNRHRLH